MKAAKEAAMPSDSNPSASDTRELQRRDARHHLHPFTDAAALAAKGARVIVAGEGVWLIDSEGKRILDGMSGLWCVNVGYGRRRIVEAVAEQMAQLPYYNTFFQTSHPPAIALAAKLAEIAPSHLGHVFFVGSGSEAADTVVRLVRHYWATVGEPSKRIIIARKNAYHGSTMAGASLGGMAHMHAQGGLPIPGIVHIEQPYWYGEGGEMDPAAFGLARARALEAAIERLGPENVAAFMAEPVQGAGGVIIPPESYWPEIERICRDHDVLLVSDEVITGFGRLGAWFGFEHFGFTPDIVTVAKGLTSGYVPMGAVLVGDRVAEPIIAEGGEFAHGFTYSGHPVAAAAALANLAIIEDEGLISRVRDEVAPYIAARWSELGEHPLVGEARMVGLMGALELTPDKARRAGFPEPGKVGFLCRDLSFENGLVMRSVGDKMIIAPPLVISREEIDALITRARLTLDQTAREIGLGGAGA